MRFSILTAVSTPSQAKGWDKPKEEKDIEDKDSLGNQEKKDRTAGLSRGWVETAGPYVIPGISRNNRVNLRDAENEIPDLHRCIEDAKANLFDVLIIYDYNRLRDLLDPVAKTLASYGVQIASVNQWVEPLPREEFNPYASDSESMTRGLSQIISRWQIADLRRKYYFGVPSRVRKGLPGLRIPYGYMKPFGRELDPKVVPVQGPSIWVPAKIRELFMDGMGVLEIARKLDELNVPTPEGAPLWQHSTIIRILKNPFYAGKVFFQRTRTVRDPNTPDKPRIVPNAEFQMEDGAHKPIYSWEDYLAIQAELKRRLSSPRNRRYPFSGLLVCSVCGAHLVHDHGMWRCKINGQPRQDHIGLSVEEAMAFVPRAVQKAVSNSNPTAPTELPKRDTESEIAELEKQRRKVQSFAEREIYSPDEAEKKIKAINKQIHDLKDGETAILQRKKEREQFMLTLETARELVEVLPRWVAEQDTKRVNDLLLRLCKEIIVTPDGIVTAKLWEP